MMWHGLRRGALRRDAADADEVTALDAGYPHIYARFGSLDHLAVADVDAEVVDWVAKKQQVAGSEVGRIDANSAVEL